MSSFLTALVFGIVWSLALFVLALPWLAALDPRSFRAALRRPVNWAIALGICVGAGAALAVFVGIVQDPARLAIWGRFFGAILELQLLIDFFVLIFPVLTWIWPKGSAVALAAFREGVRQPMFWFIIILSALFMMFSPFWPYFTFGED